MENLLTVEEVSTFLKISKKTIYNLVSQHRIPSVKVGGARRFRLQDIQAWIVEDRGGK